jgi:dimethylglycine dehydrogenase
MAIGAQSRGAKIIRHNRVTGVSQLPNGEWLVDTEQGPIACEHVVNAGGCYAREIAALVGHDLPVVNMLHQYFVTDTIPELVDFDSEIPVTRDPRCSCYMRQEQKSGLIGPYETTGAQEAWPGTSQAWDAEHELFEADYDRTGAHLEGAMELMPIFADKGIKSVIHGAIPHTPDGNPYLGPAPGLRNFWHCNGSAIGIAQGPGSGEYLAQMMIHGAADICMAAYDPRRFQSYATRQYTLEKAIEEYHEMYVVPVNGMERHAARPARVSPLYKTLGAKGAVYTEAAGWERPKWFSLDGREENGGFRRTNVHEVVGEECRAVRQRIGIMDMTSFAKFEVSGPDAETFLNRITANRVPKKTGGIVLTHPLTDGGRILGEFTITRTGDDRFYLLSAATAELRDLDTLQLQKHADESVSITNVTEEYGVLVVSGPKTRDVLSKLTDADLTTAAFRWLTAQQITLAGVDMLALRVSYVGELGWELHVPVADLKAVYDAVWQAGETSGIANFGSYAMNSLRMEKAYRGWGSELTAEISPLEADMERFIRLDKQGFVGRDALLAQKQSGVTTSLVYLEVNVDDADVSGGEPVFANGEYAGVTTSGGYGFITGKSLGFAYVKAPLSQPDTELEILILGKMHKATVLSEPLFDPENERLRA